LIVRASHLDSDQDGLLDFWETSGIDMNSDGIPDLNLMAMGAKPKKRDLFVEIDWTGAQADRILEPAPGVIRKPNGPGPLVTMFANAPLLSGSMYGATIDSSPPEDIPLGISLHVDAGPGVDTSGRSLSYDMPAGFRQGGDIVRAGPSSPPVDVIYFGLPALQCGSPPGPCPIPSGVVAMSYHDVKDRYFGTTDKRGRELAFPLPSADDFQGLRLRWEQPSAAGRGLKRHDVHDYVIFIHWHGLHELP
jgi:hypothetical protein